MVKLNAISEGDIIVIRGTGFEYRGAVMPSTEEDTLVLKLDNGYNVGILKKKVRKVILITKSKKSSQQVAKIKFNLRLPKVTIVSTGGTITSKVDYRTGAVSPLSKPEELLAKIPELSRLANIRITSPFSKLSEYMLPDDWKLIAEVVARELNKGVEGVVVTHGTDTLHYTAAALSFMLRGLSKPVALVGGQRSSDRGSFDGAQNLICAVRYCLSDIAEVAVVMHASSNDDFCYAIRGTKVRKMHSSRRDAFRPINCFPLAKINPKDGLEILAKNFNKRTNKKVFADTRLEQNVVLIKYSPGLQPDVLDYYIDKGYKGIVLEGTGFGHVGENWFEQIKRATKHAVICMTTQTIYGTTNNHIYSAGVELDKAGVVYCKDTLPETAYIKLMWLLKQTPNLMEVKKKMTQDLVGEINSCIEKKSFLY